MAKKIKLYPAPHVELRVHVSDEMIQDIKKCNEHLLKDERFDCSNCSWKGLELYAMDLCDIPDVRKEKIYEETDSR